MFLSLSKTNETRSGPEHCLEQISLNDIMQRALQRLLQENKKQDIIVRCQSLPHIEADRKDIERVFNDMVRMIIHHPPMGTRLFLHINCEEERSEAGGAEWAKNTRRYRISFHTNICTDEAWKTANEKTIDGCSALLARYGAGITVNEITSTGCLFSISLLGKM